MPLTELEAQSILEKLNIPKEDWISPKIEVRKSQLGGKGMFAKKPINEGKVVLRWGAKPGNVFSEEEIRTGKARKRSSIEIEEGIYLAGEANVLAEDSDFLNHSCDSNLWMSDSVTLVARRNIKEGEEVTADYALWQGDVIWVANWDCKCGQTVCRHKVTGKDWKLPKVQERYKNHFSPFLNRRIERQRS
ncbi:hypothetical protein A2Z22_00860 [Candidatus Woesebacteria bacterium RBG_16_34_12]|uniref:SET domain-containing protein n=1 Tax=Candidatus Woesebacteria bacterium RBG_16_34_12 TaxID=1802480 RepID=A0A1F7XAN0_9BACT|nr:MAG: hypothetical protein A2Z22_00860 [Candidatus Woesebacteria bacterium RBG_16_34_12]